VDAVLDRGRTRDGTAVLPAVSQAPTSGGPLHPDQRHPSTWRSGKAWAALLVVTALGLVLDLWSKDLAFRYVAGRPVVVERQQVLRAAYLSDLIPPHPPVEVVPGWLHLTLVLNPGAVFGIGAGKRVFFIVFTVLALGFGLWMFGAWTRRRDYVAHGAIGLLLAGGLGNLYDRLVYACVRDFIHPLPMTVWPGGGGKPVWPYVSNVADLFLLIGIAVLVVHVWRTGRHDGVGPGAARGRGRSNPQQPSAPQHPPPPAATTPSP
jgi:signal peptidase II